MSSLYPLQPGHGPTDTSTDAAASVESKAAALRLQVLELVRKAAKHDPGVLLPGVRPVVAKTPARNSANVPVGITAREASKILGEDDDNVHPRFSELRAAGLIRDSGVRRVNAHSGRKAIAWVPGDDPDKASAPTDNAPPVSRGAKLAYVAGMAAAYHMVASADHKEAALSLLQFRLDELDRSGSWRR